MVFLRATVLGLLQSAMEASRQGDAALVGRDTALGREKLDKEGTKGGSHPRTMLGKKAGLGGFLPNTSSIPTIQIRFEAVRGNI